MSGSPTQGREIFLFFFLFSFSKAKYSKGSKQFQKDLIKITSKRIQNLQENYSKFDGHAKKAVKIVVLDGFMSEDTDKIAKFVRSNEVMFAWLKW